MIAAIDRLFGAFRLEERIAKLNADLVGTDHLCLLSRVLIGSARQRQYTPKRAVLSKRFMAAAAA